MKKKKNIAASVRAKLTNRAKETGENLQNIFIRFANERLLYRLNQTEHSGKFLLKGAALFAFWFDKPHRPTRDMDLLGSGKNDIPTLENIIRQMCEVKEEDGLNFLPETVKGGLIREEEEYQGVRITLTAMLERARIPVQIDIGFGDVVTPRAEETELKTLLDFPPPCIRIYPKETVVAESSKRWLNSASATGG